MGGGPGITQTSFTPEQIEEMNKKRAEQGLDPFTDAERSNLGQQSVYNSIFQNQQREVAGLKSQVADLTSTEGPTRGEVIQQMLSGQLETLKKRRGMGTLKTSGRGADGSPMASSLLLGS